MDVTLGVEHIFFDQVTFHMHRDLCSSLTKWQLGPVFLFIYLFICLLQVISTIEHCAWGRQYILKVTPVSEYSNMSNYWISIFTHQLVSKKSNYKINTCISLQDIILFCSSLILIKPASVCSDASCRERIVCKPPSSIWLRTWESDKSL